MDYQEDSYGSYVGRILALVVGLIMLGLFIWALVGFANRNSDETGEVSSTTTTITQETQNSTVADNRNSNQTSTSAVDESRDNDRDMDETTHNEAVADQADSTEESALVNTGPSQGSSGILPETGMGQSILAMFSFFLVSLSLYSWLQSKASVKNPLQN